MDPERGDAPCGSPRRCLLAMTTGGGFAPRDDGKKGGVGGADDGSCRHCEERQRRSNPGGPPPPFLVDRRGASPLAMTTRASPLAGYGKGWKRRYPVVPRPLAMALTMSSSRDNRCAAVFSSPSFCACRHSCISRICCRCNGRNGGRAAGALRHCSSLASWSRLHGAFACMHPKRGANAERRPGAQS